MATETDWRERLIEVKQMRAGDIEPHPLNPKIHPPSQNEALTGLLEDVGKCDILKAYYSQREGGKLVFFDGHARQGLKPDEIWNVGIYDVTDDEADKLLLTFDPIAQEAQTSQAKMEMLLHRTSSGNAAVMEFLTRQAERAGIVPPMGSGNGEPLDAEPQIDKAAELNEKWKVKTGDVFSIGAHRLMCGDSTKTADVGRLMSGGKSVLCQADPPYGMGKEADGVANDNLYAAKLDAFQMQWWKAFRPHLEDNGSAYIWGNAEDLWRLWYVGGLKDSERLTFRNEITWYKGDGGFGVGASAQRCYFPQERCLFFMLGEQGFNNDADNYWEGWEPIRSWLSAERERSGLTTDQCNKICGKQNMTQSAFTKGGFRLILQDDYEKLREATGGKFFKREHDELKREHDELKREFYETHAFFDNTHDNMTDVWQFGRVTGEERWSHATPKPVEMIARALKSSSPEGAVVAVPFGGSGSDFVAGENTGRKIRGMELQPEYCAVILERMATAFPSLEIRQA